MPAAGKEKRAEKRGAGRRKVRRRIRSDKAAPFRGRSGCQKTLGLSRAAALDFQSVFSDMCGENGTKPLVLVLFSFCRPEMPKAF